MSTEGATDLDQFPFTIRAHRGVAVDLVHRGTQETQRARVKRNSGHVVGDVVRLDGEGLVRGPRRTELARRSPKGRLVIAANVDVVAVLVTVEPPPRWGFVDRTIAGARAAGIEPWVVVSKVDLPGVADYAAALARRFEGAVPVFAVSAQTGEGVDTLIEKLAGRMVVFIGPSGVGKSSLTNRLLGNAEIEVGALSDATGRGRHTTTAATHHRGPQGLHVIDTPGIRDFGLDAFTRADFAARFARFEPFADQCRFRDCLHQHEPGCAVAAAVKDGSLPQERWDTYRKLLAQLEEDNVSAGRNPRGGAKGKS